MINMDNALNIKSKNDTIYESSSAVFILLAVIYGSYLNHLLPCSVQDQLQSNLITMHFVGLLSFYFFASVLIRNVNITQRILISLFSYLFLIFFVFKSHRTGFFIGSFFLVCVIITNEIYNENLSRAQEKNETIERQQYRTVMGVFTIISVLIFFTGTMWNIRKHYRQRDTFTLKKFFFNIKECNRFTLDRKLEFLKFYEEFIDKDGRYTRIKEDSPI
jgi:hypothetical protein